MGNLGGAEILVILLVALVVLGPTKLPEAARQVGKAVTELRRMSSGFQRELQEAMHDPVVEAEARRRGDEAVARPASDTVADDTAPDGTVANDTAADDPTGTEAEPERPATDG